MAHMLMRDFIREFLSRMNGAYIYAKCYANSNGVIKWRIRTLAILRDFKWRKKLAYRSICPPTPFQFA